MQFLHADNKQSDKTARMHRLIWIFVARTFQNISEGTISYIPATVIYIVTRVTSKRKIAHRDELLDVYRSYP